MSWALVSLTVGGGVKVAVSDGGHPSVECTAWSAEMIRYVEAVRSTGIGPATWVWLPLLTSSSNPYGWPAPSTRAAGPLPGTKNWRRYRTRETPFGWSATGVALHVGSRLCDTRYTLASPIAALPGLSDMGAFDEKK